MSVRTKIANLSTDCQNKYFISTGTVAQPVHVQTAPLAPIVSGTFGHTGPVEYSRSATAVVSETYVVTTKRAFK